MPLTRSPSCFDRVTVDYLVRGNARITWYHRRDYVANGTPAYQLQVSRDGNDPDQWTNVGLTTTGNYAIDDTRRLFGKDMRLTYRIKLTTPDETFYSEPAQPFGLLSKRQWLLARAIIRRKLLMPRWLTSFEGYLLKRKLHGIRCSCVDPITKGVTNADCELCNGTGKIEGYWLATENNMYDMQPEGNYTKTESARGTVNDSTVTAMCIGLPVLNSRDVWVSKQSDRRYYVHRVENLSEINSVPLVVRAHLRLAEFTDVIYTLPVEML